MPKIKKFLMHSTTTNSLKTSCLIFYSNTSAIELNNKSLGVSYSSFKFLKIFKFFKSTSFKFPLRVTPYDLQGLKNFLLISPRVNLHVRYNSFLFEDISNFLFFKTRNSIIFLFFIFLVKPNLSFYRICRS